MRQPNQHGLILAVVGVLMCHLHIIILHSREAAKLNRSRRNLKVAPAEGAEASEGRALAAFWAQPANDPCAMSCMYDITKATKISTNE